MDVAVQIVVGVPAVLAIWWAAARLLRRHGLDVDLERELVAWSRRFVLRAHEPERIGALGNAASGDDVVCLRCRKRWPCDPVMRVTEQERR